MQEPTNDRFNEGLQAIENREVTEPLTERDHAPDGTSTQHAPVQTNDSPIKKKTIRQSRPVFVLILAVFMAALGAATGVIVYRAYFEQQPAATTTQPAQEAAAPVRVTAASLISGIKSKLKTAVAETGERSEASMLTTDNYVAYSVPVLRPPGYNFTTVPIEIHGVSTSTANQPEIDADILAAKQHLESKGLQAGGEKVDAVNNILGSVDFTSDSVKCTVSSTHHANIYRSHIGCADVSSYEANAKQLKPLYDAYINTAELSTRDNVYMGKATITDSTVAGYRRAEVSVGTVNDAGGAIGKFYQGPDKTWHWLIGTQDVLLCTSYPAGDARKAFAGEPCATDSSGNLAKVTP